MKDPRLERAGVEGFNKPKKTPSHPTKSHVVVAKSGDQVVLICQLLAFFLFLDYMNYLQDFCFV